MSSAGHRTGDRGRLFLETYLAVTSFIIWFSLIVVYASLITSLWDFSIRGGSTWASMSWRRVALPLIGSLTIDDLVMLGDACQSLLIWILMLSHFLIWRLIFIAFIFTRNSYRSALIILRHFGDRASLNLVHLFSLPISPGFILVGSNLLLWRLRWVRWPWLHIFPLFLAVVNQLFFLDLALYLYVRGWLGLRFDLLCGWHWRNVFFQRVIFALVSNLWDSHCLILLVTLLVSLLNEFWLIWHMRWIVTVAATG